MSHSLYYDQEIEAWVENGRVARCQHWGEFVPSCGGCQFAGRTPEDAQHIKEQFDLQLVQIAEIQ